jgi:polysaccharide biosynthesis protein PslH
MADPLRILWLKTGPLHPLDTGGKLRTYHLLRELNRCHHVTYFALRDGDSTDDPSIFDQATEYSSEQRWFDWREVPKATPGFYLDLLKNYSFSSRPYVIDKYVSREMAAAIRILDEEGKLDLIICDFLTPAINLFPAGNDRLKAPTMIFQHNVEAQIWKRMAEQAGNVVQRTYLRGQWRRMQAYEAASCRVADAVVSVSEGDSRQLREEYGLSNVLGHVSTGVDIDYFSDTARTERRRGGKDIVFLGSMDWLPNIDAVEFFAETMWSKIRSVQPEARLVIVGRRPTPAVKALADQDPSIEVTGTVPDVRPFVSQAAAVVVPLRIGGGTRIKIYEAMSMGVPVVSTTIGAEGLDVTHGKNILLADDPETFVAATLEILGDPEVGERIGRAGALHVREHYSWPVVAREFEQLCQQTVARRPVE